MEHNDKWTELELAHGIKFRLKDGTFRPVNEWLDDIYLQLTPQQACDFLLDLYSYGEQLFRDLTSHHE